MLLLVNAYFVSVHIHIHKKKKPKPFHVNLFLNILKYNQALCYNHVSFLYSASQLVFPFSFWLEL